MSYLVRDYYGYVNYEIFSPGAGAWINVKFMTIWDYLSGGKQATALAFLVYVG